MTKKEQDSVVETKVDPFEKRLDALEESVAVIKKALAEHKKEWEAFCPYKQGK